MGSNGFRAISERQDVQSQISAIRASLQSDLQKTHFYGVFERESLPVTIDSVSISRDGLSCVSLDSWQNSSNFSDAGLPQWNQWVVFRVTHEEKGKLIRHVIDPNSGESGLALLKEPLLLATVINESQPSRSAWADVTGTRNIAENIQDFQVKLDADARSVDITVTIKKDSIKSNLKSESVEANFFIQPHNTGPGD